MYKRQQARIAAQEVGIIFKTPIYAFVKKGGYGDFFLGESLDGKDEIKAEFSRFLQVKPDYMKVVSSGLVSFDVYGEISPGGFTLGELEYLSLIHI